MKEKRDTLYIGIVKSYDEQRRYGFIDRKFVNEQRGDYYFSNRNKKGSTLCRNIKKGDLVVFDTIRTNIGTSAIKIFKIIDNLPKAYEYIYSYQDRNLSGLIFKNIIKFLLKDVLGNLENDFFIRKNECIKQELAVVIIRAAKERGEILTINIIEKLYKMFDSGKEVFFKIYLNELFEAQKDLDEFKQYFIYYLKFIVKQKINISEEVINCINDFYLNNNIYKEEHTKTIREVITCSEYAKSVGIKANIQDNLIRSVLKNNLDDLHNDFDLYIKLFNCNKEQLFDTILELHGLLKNGNELYDLQRIFDFHEVESSDNDKLKKLLNKIPGDDNKRLFVFRFVTKCLSGESQLEKNVALELIDTFKTYTIPEELYIYKYSLHCGVEGCSKLNLITNIDAKSDKEIYHLTSIDNFRNIVRYGLFSRDNALEKGLVERDIGNKAILRKRIVNICGIQISLSQLIPFHFITKTAFDYEVRDNNMLYIAVNKLEYIKHDDWSAFIIPSHPLNSYYDNLIYKYDEGMERIDWSAMNYKGYCYREYQQKRMAEYLLECDAGIQINDFSAIYVYDIEMRNRILELLPVSDPKRSILNRLIVVNPKLFS